MSTRWNGKLFSKRPYLDNPNHFLSSRIVTEILVGYCHNAFSNDYIRVSASATQNGLRVDQSVTEWRHPCSHPLVFAMTSPWVAMQRERMKRHVLQHQELGKNGKTVGWKVNEFHVNERLPSFVSDVLDDWSTNIESDGSVEVVTVLDNPDLRPNKVEGIEARQQRSRVSGIRHGQRQIVNWSTPNDVR
jgi:hypothetical protein